ncbi:alpha/beta hydrolase family protein [Actinoplanes xinjiangensis]|uniref:Platelet-activating factor acetylhydrolase isoform II n=1 Tax=Actinoplanes xinjiangensis TaxID=512350 RepID=A0A316EMG2_9ACTN|nr:carboxylic ester hydrolase [Actinoplanes xinjiangensis]PWK30786.1 platelet-activating factor acetylhydrolase isoform II [Actinoplanes xinjiangensis]GIF44231.1 carboxylic ester hydrolase [Actinoplanes xinjiangensis]
MRPVEAMLAAANLIGFLVTALPRMRRRRQTGYLLAVPAIVAVVQVLAEGFRWQVVPGYALALALPGAWLLRRATAGRLHLRGWIARTARIAGLAGCVIVLVPSVALPVVVPVFHFPAPTGRYGIGTVTYHWVDRSRPELLTADPADRREVMAQVWYPATPAPGAERAPYIADAGAVTSAAARLADLPPFLFSHFRYVTTNAVAAAPVAADEDRYPVLVFLSGLYGFRSVSTFQIEELVSHGYVVVGLDQPGVVATVRLPDGRRIENLPIDEIGPLVDQSIEPQPATPALNGVPQPDGLVPYFVEDVRLALDELTRVDTRDPYGILTGRLDLGRAGVFGVSLGGRVAAESCLRDARLKACLVMDDPVPSDVVAAGLRQPTMFLTRDAETMRLERRKSGGWTEHDIATTLDTMRAAYAKLSGGGYYVEIPDLFHVNFTDLPYWLPASEQLGLTGPIGGRRGFAVVNAYTVAFFDQVLRGRTSPLLDEASRLIPEATVDVRPPSGQP